jgi:hypothetical protein
MQIPPVNTIWTEGWHFYHFLIAGLAGVTWQKVFNAFVKSMPPLPTNANFWERWGYAFLNLLADTTPSGTPK